MSLPRMQPQDGVAWITGASSGIGEAVALELARRGWTVAITARRLEQLENIARLSEGLPGRIVAHAGDVTQTDSMHAVVDGIESVHGPIALAFFNAGIAARSDGDLLVDVAALELALSVNTLGVARGIAAVAERMRPRKRGQIVVNASAAGFGGLPGVGVYGSSKAATIHLCEALKFDCDALGIRLQLLNPGFIDTPMTQANRFTMPFLLPIADAARRIVDGFERGGFEITLPRRLSWFLKLANMLPYPAYFWLISAAAGRGRKGGRP
jgi:NAD(P)-dependent dehydrogenase (short-subunit alcohol dehydrogenase family)